MTVLALMATGAACAEQSGGLGGAALPQHDTISAGAPVDDPVAPDDPLAPESVAGSPPIAVPYQSNDDAPSRRANPWLGLLAEVDGQVAAPDAAEDPPAVDASAVDAVGAAVDAGMAAAAGGDAPIRRSALPTTGTPDACRAMLKPFANALKAGSYGYVGLTTATADGRYTSHATGSLRHQTKPAAVGAPPSFTLDGTLEQLFSDRTYDRPRVLPPGTTKCLLPCTMPQSFDAGRPDSLFMQIDGATGSTTLILRSWGDSTVRLTPSWGYGGGTFYVATLRVGP